MVSGVVKKHGYSEDVDVDAMLLLECTLCHRGLYSAEKGVVQCCGSPSLYIVLKGVICVMCTCVVATSYNLLVALGTHCWLQIAVEGR